MHKPAMSLFTEAVNRVAELEAALASEKERNRNLEIIIKTERTAKLRAQGWPRPKVETPEERAKKNYNPFNTMKPEDVEAQFAAINTDFKMIVTYPDEDAGMVEEVDTADLKSAADSVSVRGRFLAPALKFCALFKCDKNA